jgi:hypothetical protein
VLSRQSGLVVATLRIREGEPDFYGHLRAGFVRLWDLYGPGHWDVTVTANVILRSTVDGRFSVFMGQSFGETRDYNMTLVQVVSRLEDVQDLRVDFGVEDFAEAFFGNHHNTSVAVHSVLSIVYLISQVLEDYEEDRVIFGRGARQRTLY